VSNDTTDDNVTTPANERFRTGLAHLLTGQSEDNTPTLVHDIRGFGKGFSSLAFRLALVGGVLWIVIKLLSQQTTFIN